MAARHGMAWAFEQAVGLVWYYEVSNPLVSLWGAARWIAYFMTRLGSRPWTFDRLNTLTCGFTSQVDEICALQ